MRDIVIHPNTVVMGELGLGGEVRMVSQIESRLKEAAKLGLPRQPCPGFVGRPYQVFGPHPVGVEREAQMTWVVQEVMRHCVVALAPVGGVHLTGPINLFASVELVDV